MSAVDIISRVISAGVLSESLTYVPKGGASNDDIKFVESKLRRKISEQHRILLERWNGINLDVVRVYGATATKGELKGILDVQEMLDHEAGERLTAFCESPAGMIYFEDADGSILMLDLDGDGVERVASGINDFFDRFVFGRDAAQFAGSEWFNELKEGGVLE